MKLVKLGLVLLLPAIFAFSGCKKADAPAEETKDTTTAVQETPAEPTTVDTTATADTTKAAEEAPKAEEKAPEAK